jgi:DNA-binding NarL/FixJ family response regulator
MIKVAVVEDHRIVVDGLEKIITESGIAQLTGKAFNITECWKMLAKLQPNVLLLDVGLPDGSGIELCPQIKEKYPAIQILMLTNYAELNTIMRALDGGATGYILKNAMSEEIIEGIRVVASGERFLCEEVNVLLKKREAHPVRLTRREQELLRLIATGCTNSEIADKMCLGYETIKSYRKNLIFKLNVHNTAQLVKIAIEQRLI